MPLEGETSAAVTKPEVAAPRSLARSAATDRLLLLKSSLTFASRLLARLSQLIFLVAVARLLSVHEFAAYSYLVGLAITFSMLGNTGVALAASREVSAGRRAPGDAYASAVPVVIVGAALAALVTWAFGALSTGPGSTPGLLLLVAGFVAANLGFNFNATMLRGVGRFWAEALLQAGSAVAFLAVGLGAASAGFGLAAVLAALLLKEAVTAGVSYAVLRPSLEGRLPERAWRPMLWTGLRLGVAATALALASRNELIVLGNSASADQVAWFSAPLRIADTGLVFALTAGFSLLPGTTFLAAKDPARVRRLVWRSVLGAAAVGVAVAVVGMIGAEPLITAIFGERFAPAADTTRILLAAFPAYGALGMIWYSLISLDRDRALVTMAIACAVVSIAAAIAYIPGQGATGAAYVYAGSLTLMAVAGAVLLRSRLRHLRKASPPGREPSHPVKDSGAPARSAAF